MFNKKVIVIAVSAVLILALAGVGIYGVVSNGDTQGSSTSAPVGDGVSDGTDQAGQVSGTTQAPTTTAPAPALSELILGKWSDSANMSGYHFYPDGTVEMTYVNLTVPIINIPINGTSKGTYVLDGDKLTTKFSIYSATIEDSYTVKVENNTLSMFDLEDRETATYSKVTAEATTSPSVSGTQAEVIDETEIVGSWTDADGAVTYSFNKDGTVIFTIDGEGFSGVYIATEDKVTIQYTAGKRKITEEYDYTVSKNSLSLKDDKDTLILVRKGTTFAPTNQSGIIGKWMDGANMGGYEFQEGGVAKVTLVNFTIPVINMPINGTFTGSYSVSGDKLTVNYSIYGNSITNEFTFSVKDNVLSLTDEEGKTSTYLKQ